MMLIDGDLQANLSQRSQAAKGFSQTCKPGKVTPDNTQHLSIAEPPETRFKTVLLDGPGQSGDIRWVGFVKTFCPGRVAVQQAGGKIAAIPDLVQTIFSR